MQKTDNVVSMKQSHCTTFWGIVSGTISLVLYVLTKNESEFRLKVNGVFVVFSLICSALRGAFFYYYLFFSLYIFSVSGREADRKQVER